MQTKEPKFGFWINDLSVPPWPDSKSLGFMLFCLQTQKVKSLGTKISRDSVQVLL